MGATLADVFAAQISRVLEIPYSRGGRTWWLSVHFGPIVKDGEVISAILHARDVTELRRAERERAELGALLHAVVPKKVRLAWQIPEDLPPVDADWGQLQQVVMTLITNAGESLGDRAGTVTIAAGVRTLAGARLDSGPLPGGDYVALSVADTRSGIEPAIRERMFEPFFTTKATGRGLGLAAVLGIVRRHGGGLHVESELGKGTIVHLYLPARAAGAPAERPCAPPAAALRAPGGEAPEGAILVVDDEPAIRELAADILASAGYEVIGAADGDEALAAFARARDRIRLVLLDLTMPERSGYEVFGDLRRLSPDLRIVIATGYDPGEDASLLRQQGAAGFLQKPFRVADLLAAVRGA